MSPTILAAWCTYIALVGLIYKIAEKAENFLSEDALKDIKLAGKNHPASRVLSGVIYITISIVDRFLMFKQDGVFFRPLFYRSMVFSMVMVLLASFPLQLYIVIAGGAPVSVFEIIMNSTFGYHWLLFFLLTIILSDYISFAKTRSVLAKFIDLPFPYREINIIVLDLVLSPTICALVYVIASMALLNFEFYPWLTILFVSLLITISIILIRSYSYSLLRVAATGLAILVISASVSVSVTYISAGASFTGSRLGFFVFALLIMPGALVYSVITSLGIAIVSVLVVCLQELKRLIWLIENKDIWRWLNFEEKPTEAAAVVLIAIFTMCYWPLVLLSNF